ncbi:MAG: response regulator [Planctomycetota bacterium]|nr:response regulator [Planctomycetota bacterium]
MDAQRHRVLILEDEAELGQLIKTSLQAEYEVTVVDDAGRALEFARSGLFDAIMTDLNLPNMDGTEFIVSLVSECANKKPIPIAVMTGLAQDDLRLQVVQDLAAVYCVLLKPFKFQLLGNLLKCMIEGDAERAKHIARMSSVDQEYASGGPE